MNPSKYFWIPFLSVMVSSHLIAETSETRDLHLFLNSYTLEGWEAVNDGVMGGRSRGSAERGDSGMIFSGVLSLENNGGFSSVRHNQRLDLSGFEGLRLKVCGDGREYQMRLQTDTRFRGWPVSYMGSFATRSNEWMEVEVPFQELTQSFRGRELEDYPFESGKVEMLGLMLADKRPGPFQLKVEWIRAFRQSMPLPGSSRLEVRPPSGPRPMNSETIVEEFFAKEGGMPEGWSRESTGWVSSQGVLEWKGGDLGKLSVSLGPEPMASNLVSEFLVRLRGKSQKLDVGWQPAGDSGASSDYLKVLSLKMDSGSGSITVHGESRTGVSPGDWHRIRLAHWGPYLRVFLDGESLAPVSRSDWAGPKGRLVFIAEGEGLDIDEIRVWKPRRVEP